MAIPVPLLLLGLSALGLKVLGGRNEKGERCENFPKEHRDDVNNARRELKETIQEPANLAPKRVLFDNGEAATSGTLQLIWKSDGPWGPVGCIKPDYMVKGLLLAEVPIAQKDIPIDIDAMLGEYPWGPDDVPDELLLQRHAAGEPSDDMHRWPQDLIYLSHGVSQKDRQPSRRSWIEAQVGVGNTVWVTDPVPKRLGADVPKAPLESAYGAIEGNFEIATGTYGRQDQEFWPGMKKIVGPDALLLLRPNAEGRGRAISVYGTHFIDITLMLDPFDSDIIFQGKDWLSFDKISAALNNNDLLQIYADARPGGYPLRAIDVLLWLVFQVAEHDVQAHGGGDAPRAGSLDYLNAIGNRSSAVWQELFAKKPGWSPFLFRNSDVVEGWMQQQGVDPFS